MGVRPQGRRRRACARLDTARGFDCRLGSIAVPAAAFFCLRVPDARSLVSIGRQSLGHPQHERTDVVRIVVSHPHGILLLRRVRCAFQPGRRQLSDVPHRSLHRHLGSLPRHADRRPRRDPSADSDLVYSSPTGDGIRPSHDLARTRADVPGARAAAWAGDCGHSQQFPGAFGKPSGQRTGARPSVGGFIHVDRRLSRIDRRKCCQ